MIIKIKHNQLTDTFYVYRRPSLTKRVVVELRKRRTKAMTDFMETAKVKNQGHFLIYW